MKTSRRVGYEIFLGEGPPLMEEHDTARCKGKPLATLQKRDPSILMRMILQLKSS